MQSERRSPRRAGRVGRPATSSLSGLSGSFRITAGASGRGEISATSSSISRFDRWTARFRRASWFSGVRCGASFAMAVRCSSAVGQHAQKEGMLSRGARGGDPEVGLGLGEVKDLGAVHEHRGGGFAGVEPAPVDLANVGDEGGLVATGLTEQIRQATEQLVVGERCQRVSAFHEDNIGRRFATSRDRLCRAQCGGPSLEGSRGGSDVRGVAACRTRALSGRSATSRGEASESCQGESEEKAKPNVVGESDGGGHCGIRLRKATAEGDCGRRLRKATAEGDCGRRLRKATAEGDCGRRLRKATAEGDCGRRRGRPGAGEARGGRSTAPKKLGPEDGSARRAERRVASDYEAGLRSSVPFAATRRARG